MLKLKALPAAAWRRPRVRIDHIERLWCRIKKYDKCPANELPRQVYYDNAELNSLLAALLRGGREHELPPELRRVLILRINAARALGQRQWLRRARRGYESGVRLPYTADEMLLWKKMILELDKLRALCNRSQSRLSENEFLQHLKDKGILPQQYSRAALQKLCKRLNIQNLQPNLSS